MKKTKSGRKREWVMAVILVTAVFLLMWWLAPWEKSEHSEARLDLSSAEGNLGGVRRAIDGVMVEPGKEHPPIAGVMVENMIEAQPISGIADAALVVEAVTEANITRFLAYFVLPGDLVSETLETKSQNIANVAIGPVRSARPYYLDWASEFDTLFTHVGSSPAAYELLRKQGVEGVYDLDQWYKSEYFVTKAGRARPHHLYTNTELLKEAYQTVLAPTTPNPSSGRRGNESISSPFEGEVRRGLSSWQFKNDAPPDLRGNVNDIRVGYIAPYAVQWLYDKSANHYKRIQWGGSHKDAGGKEIMAKNIAVAFQEMEILDDIGRKKFNTMGEGKGLVFQDGRVVVGTWKKPGAKADALTPGEPGVKADALTPGEPGAQERMRWYNGQGNEVEFNAGTTWIEIVPKGYEVTY